MQFLSDFYSYPAPTLPSDGFQVWYSDTISPLVYDYIYLTCATY